MVVGERSAFLFMLITGDWVVDGVSLELLVKVGIGERYLLSI